MAAEAEAYVRARLREGRILPDDVVATLPHVPDGHPLASEWRLRADSCRRLVRYLHARHRPLRVVELGCGNGWLANHIAAIPHTLVMGTDVNDVELAQASRVFGRRHRNLDFVHHDMRDAELPMPHVDVIVLASAIQYLVDPAPPISLWLDLLMPQGEIHILDSPVYTRDEVAAARERTRRHYAAIGVPDMADAYHHHTWESFGPFHVEVLHRPDAAMTRLRRRVLRSPLSPFPWLRISRDANR
jgi:SAM-dependent methyltransferase